MADGNENMQFEMVLDIPKFERDWTKWERTMQDYITQHPLHVKFDFDKAQLDSLKATLNQMQNLGVVGGKPSTQAAMLKAQLTGEAQAANIRNKSLYEGNLILEKTRGQLLRNEKAEIQLNAAKTRGIAATHTQNRAYQAQRGVLNGLPQMINSYVSILGAMSFVRGIKDITGQYELQRVALGAIIQDAERANRLFDEIKTKALLSPFTVKDMSTFVKQLAAFKVPTEELYSTMDMLADISAGLGVGMDRLILAYGQVKAASVLRGQELRQFTEAGIPLVELLAKKFEKLNNEATTTGDVFTLIMKRAVPFEMVKEIFQDMTKEGGSFFNMQEIQAKTVWGMWENVKDAIQIMEDEMGRANRGALMESAKLIRSLASNWRTATAILSPLVAAIIAYNAVMVISGTRTAFMAKSTLLLEKAEVFQVAAVNASTAANMRLAISTGTAAVATRAAAAANNVFTRSFYLLKAAMYAHPVLFWATILTTVGAAIYSLVTFQNKATISMNEMNASISRIRATADTSVQSFGVLMEKLKGANQGSKEYADIVNEINSRYGDFIVNQASASDSYDKVAESVKGVTDALIEKAKAEAYSTGLTSIVTTQSNQLSKDYDKTIKSMTKKGLYTSFSEKEAANIFKNITETLKNSPEQYKTRRDIAKLMGDMIYPNLSTYIKSRESKEDITSSIITGQRYKKQLAYIMDVAKSETELSAKISSLSDKVNIMYSTGGADRTSQGFASYSEHLESIKKNYAQLELQILRMPYADDKEGMSIRRTADLIELKKRKLMELEQVYLTFGQADKAKSTQKEWSMISGIGEDWRDRVNQIIKGGGGELAPKEDEDEYPYAKRMKSLYKDLLEEQKFYVSQGNKADDIAKRITTEHLAKIRQIAKVNKYELKDKAELKEDLKAESDLLKDILDKYGNKIDLIERYNKVYEKMLELTGDEKKSAELVLSITGLNMDGKNVEDELRQQVADMFAKLPKLSYSPTMSMKELRDQIGTLDPNSKEFKSAESALNALSDYMNNTQVSAMELEKKIAEFEGRIGELGAEDFMLIGTGYQLDISTIARDTIKAYKDIDVRRKKMEDEALLYKKARGEEWYDIQMAQIKRIFETEKANTKKTNQEKVDDLAQRFVKEKMFSEGLDDMTSNLGDKSLIQLENTRKQLIELGKSDISTLFTDDDIERLKKAGITLDDMSVSIKKIFASKTKNVTQEELQKLLNTASSGADEIAGLAEKFKDLAETLDDVKLAESMDAIGGVMKVLSATMKGFASGGEIGAAVAGATSIISLMVDSYIDSVKYLHEMEQAAIAYRQALEKINLDNIASGDQYKTIFGTNEWGTVVAGLEAMTQASSNYKKSMTDLSNNAAALYGNKKGDWYDGIYFGMFKGGYVASAIKNSQDASEAFKTYTKSIKKGYTELQSMAIMSNKAGWLAKIFGKKDKYVSLKDLAPQIFNEDGTVNKDALNAFLEEYGDTLSAAQKSLLENLLNNLDAYDEAQQQIIDHITDIFGDIGGSLADSFINAFETGSNALSEFTGDVKSAVREWIKEIGYMAYIAPTVADASKIVTDAVTNGTDLTEATNKALDLLFSNMPTMQAAWNEYWSSASAKWTSQTGTPFTEGSDLTGMSKSVANMSENDAKVFGSYLNSGLMQWVRQTKLQEGMSGTLVDLYAIQGQALTALNAIKANTDQLVINTNESVKDMKSVLSGTGAKSLRVQLVN
jgi:tape measure domain-containing protein